MADDAVRVWSHQFVEHTVFAKKAMRDAGITDRSVHAALTAVGKQWARISREGAPDVNDDNVIELRRLTKRTLALNRRGRQLLEDVKCSDDLLEHLLEETEFFARAILSSQLSYSAQLRWFYEEHAQNLKFVVCKLPDLYADEGLAVPPDLKKMLKEADALATELKTTGRNSRSLSALLAPWKQLSKRHLEAVNETLRYPLPIAFRATVRKMVRHEKREAVWMKRWVRQVITPS